LIRLVDEVGELRVCHEELIGLRRVHCGVGNHEKEATNADDANKQRDRQLKSPTNPLVIAA
jgi:hypothetical protein